MSFPVAGYSGFLGPQRGAPAQTRGRIQGSSNGGVSYPNPFFDVGHTYLPTTVKELFKHCRYYFLTNSLINATVFKFSEYPVTDLIIDHASSAVKNRWGEYMHDHLRYRAFQVECGLDYNTYGNCLITIHYPFNKWLKCSNCDFEERADKVRHCYTFTNNDFRLDCPSCGTISPAGVTERFLKNASGIRLVRWNVEDVDITYNEITGETRHYYNVPGPLRSDIVMGKKDVVESVPQSFIQAIREQKGVVFNPDHVFHLKRPTLAWQDRGWGIPLLLPVLKDAFYLQLMRKAQEAILLEHIVPLRILFPQAGSGSSDPYTSISLPQWKEQVASEIARWRHDANYIPIMPLPLGNQSIGGDGRSLLLFQEMQMHSELLMMGMGAPREFLQGGLSYSGSNVSMRMLENAFIGYMINHRILVQWVMHRIGRYMDWEPASGRFKPFKMADDIQRKQYLFSLNQAQKVSDHTLLADADLSQEDEDEIMVRETARRLESTKKQQIAMAEVQGEAQAVMMRHQAKAQQGLASEKRPPAPGEAGGPRVGLTLQEAAQLLAPTPSLPGQAPSAEEAAGPVMAAPPGDQMAGDPAESGSMLAEEAQSALSLNSSSGVDITQMAQSLAQQLVHVDPQQRELALQSIAAQSPELASLVKRLLGVMGAVQPSSGVDMRPLPEQRPPRRETSSV